MSPAGDYRLEFRFARPIRTFPAVPQIECPTETILGKCLRWNQPFVWKHETLSYQIAIGFPATRLRSDAHVNFSTADSSLTSGTFGQVTGGHVPRRIQLGAKLYF